jgi:hypothetical protein
MNKTMRNLNKSVYEKPEIRIGGGLSFQTGCPIAPPAIKGRYSVAPPQISGGYPVAPPNISSRLSVAPPGIQCAKTVAPAIPGIITIAPAIPGGYPAPAIRS